MLYILLSALAAVSTFGTDLSCDVRRPNQYLFYCEGFEREYPPEGWTFDESDNEDSWERIYWQSPDGLNPLDECAGRYFLLSKASNDSPTSILRGATFEVEPTWSHIRFYFIYSLINDEVANNNLNAFLVVDGNEEKKYPIYPCPLNAIDCNSIGLGNHWIGFSLPLDDFIEGKQTFQFIFEYKSDGESEIAIDDIVVTVLDEKNNASEDYPQYADRCDEYSGPPNAQWNNVDDDDSSDDDDDDKGCGCGAVDSGAGGGGFFAFALLALCLILLYRKRTWVV